MKDAPYCYFGVQFISWLAIVFCFLILKQSLRERLFRFKSFNHLSNTFFNFLPGWV